MKTMPEEQFKRYDTYRSFDYEFSHHDGDAVIMKRWQDINDARFVHHEVVILPSGATYEREYRRP